MLSIGCRWYAAAGGEPSTTCLSAAQVDVAYSMLSTALETARNFVSFRPRANRLSAFAFAAIEIRSGLSEQRDTDVRFIGGSTSSAWNNILVLQESAKTNSSKGSVSWVKRRNPGIKMATLQRSLLPGARRRPRGDHC